SDIRRLNDENVARGVLELTDFMLEASQVRRRRREQMGSWQRALFSLGGLWWLTKALLLVTMLVTFVSRVRTQRWEIVRKLDKRLAQWAPLRRRRHLALRIADVTGALLTPVTAMVCVRAMLLLFPSQLPPLVTLVSTLIQGFLLYMLLIRLLRTLILPRWYREKVFGEDGHGELREGDNPEELEQALFLVATLRLMLLYTVMCQTTLYLVRQALGMLFVGYWVHVLGYMGYVVVLYMLLTRWRNTIASLYEKYAGERAPRSVELMKEHRDRPWGLLVIFGAFLYVVVVEGGRWLFRRLEHVGLVKRARNFLFRRRVAIEQRLEREQNEGKEHDDERFTGVDAYFCEGRPDDARCIVARPLPAVLSQALEDWSDPMRQGWWVVVGPWGMGKSMVLDEVEAQSPVPVVRWQMEGRLVTRDDLLGAMAAQFGFQTVPESEEQMRNMLLAAEPRVILVDDTHRIFLREIGGFESYWIFERLMVNSSHHHLWITTMDRYAWVFLRQARRKPLTGPGVVNLEPWSSDELRQLIETRMVPSGVEISFRGLTATNDSETDEAASVRSAVGYYHLLEEVSHGNPAVAMDCWLRSLFVHGDRIEVRLFDNTGHVNNLRSLPEEARFALTALLQHGELNVAELARVLNIGESLAAELLWELGRLGLLLRGPGGRFALTRGAYGEVTEHVSSRNLLHL
ncbi:MAG: hypothetical protein AAFS10_12690, partial [Myxococcota bacterium]